MKRFAALVPILLLGVSCEKHNESNTPGPGNFALSLPVEATPVGQVQRLDLPPAALIAIERADKGDIRILDAQGRPLAIALLGNPKSRIGEAHFKAITFTMQTGGGPDPSISIHVDRDGKAVTVNTADHSPAASDQAILLDTRKLTERVAAIALEAVLPVQRPITVIVDSSTDLKSWQPLAEHVLFRPAESSALLGSGQIPLSGVALGGSYLRISWTGAPDLRVAGATLYTTRSLLAQRVVIPAAGLTLADSHHLLLNTPAGVGPSAIRVTMTGRDGIVPLQLLGRSTPDQPWTPLAMASLKQGDKGALLEFGDRAMHEFSLKADSRSAGFSEVPSVKFEYEPVSVLAAFNGAAPYRLAVGNAAAKPTYFSVSEITRNPGPYPQAKVISSGTPIVIHATDDSGPPHFTPRILTLWSILVLGTMVLAYAAYRLFRRNDEGA